MNQAPITLVLIHRDGTVTERRMTVVTPTIENYQDDGSVRYYETVAQHHGVVVASEYLDRRADETKDQAIQRHMTRTV